MKRGFAWLLTLLALLGLLSGCGGGGDTTASDTASNSAATDGADDSGGSYGAWAEAEVAASGSEFIARCLPEPVAMAYFRR